jgi:uncharacterized protein YlxW (UPF0749 family)
MRVQIGQVRVASARARTPALLAATASVLALLTVTLMSRVLPLLLTVAVAAAVGSALGRRHEPASALQAARDLRSLNADRNRLIDQVGELQTRLADAEESAHAAWDAAASRQPAGAMPANREIERMLADPLSGAHRFAP